MSGQRRRAKNAATLHDVAKHAGVSPMTASRVLSGQAKVSEIKRARVNAAVEKLGYSPDLAARSLASAGILRIGLLYGNPSATFNSEFLVDLLEESARLGCRLIVEKCADGRNPRPAAGRLIKKGVDGVLLPTPLCDSLPLLRYFETRGVVFVSAGTGREQQPGLSIRIDNARAAEEMTRHLLALGHRNIGFIRGHPGQIDSAQRYDGYVAALASAGLSVRTQWIKQGQYTFKSGFLAACELLKPRGRPSAIFASNDDMAAGALAAAHRLKLTVPCDLSIVGFDDTPLATSIWPSLTTIRQPVSELTRLALSMAVEEVRQRRRGRPPSRRQETIQLSLIQRESASAPRIARNSDP